MVVRLLSVYRKVGVPLASSRDTSNGPDWRDVAQAMLNYEHFNGCQIEVAVTALKGTKTPDLCVIARSLKDNEDGLGVIVLASASVRALQTQYRSMDAVILKCLYDLDVAMWSQVETK